MIKETPEMKMVIPKPSEKEMEVPSMLNMNDVMDYLYPLIRDAVEGDYASKMKERIYKVGLTSWDLIKVMKAIDGIEDEDKDEDE